jgi:hypothetical protein
MNDLAAEIRWSGRLTHYSTRSRISARYLPLAAQNAGKNTSPQI